MNHKSSYSLVFGPIFSDQGTWSSLVRGKLFFLSFVTERYLRRNAGYRKDFETEKLFSWYYVLDRFLL